MKPRGLFAKIKRFWLNFRHPLSTMQINMELRNGDHLNFVVSAHANHFKFMKASYVVDSELKHYNKTTRKWALDYHQDFSIPIQRKLDVMTLTRAIESTGVVEVEYATNPSTLERFIISRVAEGIMKGQQIDDFLKQIRLMIIIITVVTVGHLGLFVLKSGMLSSVKIPGIN